MNLVDKVTILGVPWTVVYKAEASDCNGMSCGSANSETHIITINTLMLKEEQEDTLYHEIFEEVCAQINAIVDSVKDGREIVLVHNPYTGKDTFTAVMSIFMDTLRRSGIL